MFGLGQGYLFKQVYSDDTLTEAWRKVRVDTHIAGVDSVTVEHFQARLFANLKTLQNDLRQRRYTPQPVKRLTISKPDGTTRPLGILTKPALTRFVTRYDARVSETVFVPTIQGKTSYRRAFELQVRQLARVLTEEQASYQPFSL